MTKGSGMIHPLMATTLGFVLTDAAIALSPLRRMVRRARIDGITGLTVDGDTSTNDTVVLLASGATCVELNEKVRTAVEEGVTAVMESLAEQIAATARARGS